MCSGLCSGGALRFKKLSKKKKKKIYAELAK